MAHEKLYLRPNVQLEPLVNQWYAWPHLIAPATAAMNIANLHVKIMKSYVSAPEIHAAAIKNPAMRGGPFLDLDRRRMNEVRALLDRTITEQAHLLEFAEAVKSLNELLLSEAKGQSLEALYPRVPEPLPGYVELVYDLNKNPSARFIEGLLYRSRYYDPSLQSITLCLINTDHRPFALSTPRLDTHDHLHFRLPFADEAIDGLFRLRSAPQLFGYIQGLLGVEEEAEKLLSSLLTEAAPQRPGMYRADRIRVRYFGHACILVESRDISILTDPIISYDYGNDFPRYTYSDLPEVIDYILITHTHADHVVFESLLQLRHKTRNIIVPRSGGGSLEDPSLKLILENIGFKSVIEIDEMQSIKVEGGAITGLPFLGEHGDLNIRSKIAHLIQLGGKSILCAADSSNLELKLYQHIHSIIGELDVLFLGMECDGAPLSWLYGPLLTRPLERKLDHSRRLSGSDYDRAIDIVSRFHCQQVYVYAMGQEPWLSFITSIKYTDESKPIVESNRLVEECRRRGINAERLLGKKELAL